MTTIVILALVVVCMFAFVMDLQRDDHKDLIEDPFEDEDPSS